MYLVQEGQPLRRPGVGFPGRQDLPGHRHGAAAVEDAEHQDGEALPEGGGVEGDGQLPPGPVVQDPAEPRSPTGVDIQFGPFAAVLGAGLLGSGAIPVAKAFADGVVLLAEQGSEGGGDAGLARGTCQGHAKGPEGQDGGHGFAEVGEVAGHLLGELVESGVAGHGGSPGRWVC